MKNAVGLVYHLAYMLGGKTGFDPLLGRMYRQLKIRCRRQYFKFNIAFLLLILFLFLLAELLHHLAFPIAVHHGTHFVDADFFVGGFISIIIDKHERYAAGLYRKRKKKKYGDQLAHYNCRCKPTLCGGENQE